MVCQMAPLLPPKWILIVPSPQPRGKTRPHLRHSGHGNTWLPVMVTRHVKERASTRIKREKLTLVPKTADAFRATVSALRSLDGRKGMCFHTISLPQNRCVRLMVKPLGRHMREDVVREELGNLGICVQGVP